MFIVKKHLLTNENKNKIAYKFIIKNLRVNAIKIPANKNVYLTEFNSIIANSYAEYRQCTRLECMQRSSVQKNPIEIRTTQNFVPPFRSEVSE